MLIERVGQHPYSEAAFKSVKYRPDYPKRFEDIKAARAWRRRFARWYNADHYHSAIGYHHPVDVHNGTAPATVTKRQTGARRRLPSQPLPLPEQAAHRPSTTRRSLDQQAHHPHNPMNNPGTPHLTVPCRLTPGASEIHPIKLT